MRIKQKPSEKNTEKGQSLIILAISFLALLAFIGLVTDVGALYVTYTQLKRAVDAAAIAAANNIKYPQDTAEQRKGKITEAAREMLQLHNVNADNISGFEVYLCTDTGLPSDFQEMCPGSGEPQRKLAYVKATQDVPVYFLHLFGISSVPFTTSAVGEAASVDLVLVFDTSESMGITSPGYDPNDFNPGSCNAANNCQPLRDAKEAAKGLIANLFSGYDQVAIVTFDYDAQVVLNLLDNIGDDDGADDGDAFAAVDNLVRLHDDAPAGKLPWYTPPGAPLLTTRDQYDPPLNPIFPDDRDGNGSDADPGAPCTDLVNNIDLSPFPDFWDDSTKQPCDDDGYLDAYDWTNDGIRGNDTGFTSSREQMSLLSTCTGCGIRVGTEVLKNGGRPTSLWVMVFLSDGVANLSDTPTTWTNIPSQFKYGFCGHDPNNAFWDSFCIDKNTGGTVGRWCIDSDSSECPPGTTSTSTSKPYSVEDYAKDMADMAALLESTNSDEPLGEDIIIYSIGMGAASAGEDVLRYMANIGEDGTRTNDECTGIPTQQNCGNYYYAPSASYLAQIFENIAARIFTKISR
jgi:hypothetical protein